VLDHYVLLNGDGTTLTFMWYYNVLMYANTEHVAMNPMKIQQSTA